MAWIRGQSLCRVQPGMAQIPKHHYLWQRCRTGPVTSRRPLGGPWAAGVSPPWAPVGSGDTAGQRGLLLRVHPGQWRTPRNCTACQSRKEQILLAGDRAGHGLGKRRWGTARNLSLSVGFAVLDQMQTERALVGTDGAWPRPAGVEPLGGPRGPQRNRSRDP